MKTVGREQNIVGWYHSHPGFGCWLSGIDVRTQKQMQMINKTFCALVVDPYRTLSSRKVDLRCFICYKTDSKTSQKSNIFESVPFGKSDEFGIWQSHYYRLEHNYFRSKFDDQIIRLIYKNYWIDTLSSNTLMINEDYANKQIADMSEKIKGYNLYKNAVNIKTHDQNEIQQRKIDDIAKLNSQSNVNLQNELIKTIIFNDA